VTVPRTLDYLIVNLNRAPYDHNARPFQTDSQTNRRTDGRTSLQWRAIRSNKRIAR